MPATIALAMLADHGRPASSAPLGILLRPVDALLVDDFDDDGFLPFDDEGRVCADAVRTIVGY